MTAMLRELAVQNLRLIEDVRVELEPGFCAWTARLAAARRCCSKRSAAARERGSSELLRAGADELRVVGRFELPNRCCRAEVARVLGAPEETTSSSAAGSRAPARATPTSTSSPSPFHAAPARQLARGRAWAARKPVIAPPAYQPFSSSTRSATWTSHARSNEVLASESRLARRHAELSAARQQRQPRAGTSFRFERDDSTRRAQAGRAVPAGPRAREKLAHAQNLRFALNACANLYDEEGRRR